MNDANLQFPAPQVTALSKPFWDGCKAGKLLIQKCSGCGHFRFYPCEGCPDCRSTDYEWTEVSGKGKLYSWIVIHRAVDPVWQKMTPFVSGVVEIDEQPGCLVPGLILGVAPNNVRDGMPVKVEFEQTGPEVSVPRWRAQ